MRAETPWHNPPGKQHSKTEVAYLITLLPPPQGREVSLLRVLSFVNLRSEELKTGNGSGLHVDHRLSAPIILKALAELASPWPFGTGQLLLEYFLSPVFLFNFAAKAILQQVR
ncbi:hypothetical protein H920_08835 [Fukomys damarensis]|uniref:Uncharacterized protein n=1 Tax=Fukomys damarensis TaxID=885580 RepID=A0A091DHE3_FUKDA|nr:hypothetical protein H920_08835 [Fukomys damarensis]